VGEELGSVDGMDCFYGFHFYNYSAFNNQIDPVSDFELLAFIHNRQRYFRSRYKPSVSEFVREAGLIRTLEESWTE
jgi:hypothetical protein